MEKTDYHFKIPALDFIADSLYSRVTKALTLTTFGVEMFSNFSTYKVSVLNQKTWIFKI